MRKCLSLVNEWTNQLHEKYQRNWRALFSSRKECRSFVSQWVWKSCLQASGCDRNASRILLYHSCHSSISQWIRYSSCVVTIFCEFFAWNWPIKYSNQTLQTSIFMSDVDGRDKILIRPASLPWNLRIRNFFNNTKYEPYSCWHAKP